MPRYTITNATSGATLGTYEGGDPVAAYYAMLDDAGALRPALRDLKRGAIEHRDAEQAILCERALFGHGPSIRACLSVMLDTGAGADLDISEEA